MLHEQLQQADIESAEWAAVAEDILAYTEHDSDLGKEMGRDAIRVTRGEMSEARFHDLYHDRMVDEFGADNRPTEGPE